MKDLLAMFPSFQRSRRAENGRIAGNSSFTSSKSKKFDLGKWFKLSTGCGTIKRSMVCDNDDSTPPSLTTANTCSSSYSPSDTISPEIGGDVPNNGLLFSRYNSRCHSIPVDSNRQNFQQIEVPTSPTRPVISKEQTNGNDNDFLDFIHGATEEIIQNDTSPKYTQRSNDHRNSSNSMSPGKNGNILTSSSKMNGSSTRPFLKQRKNKLVWHSATDPKSGKIYYYEEHSRKTQWHKPLELASDFERLAIQKKERLQREFFSSMEANIIKCMQKGVIPGSPTDKEIQEDKIHPLKKVSLVKKDLARPALIKTISSMDVELLAELTREQSIEDEQNESPMPGLSPDSVLIGNDLDSCSRERDESSFKNIPSSSFDIANEIQKVQDAATSACQGSEGLLQDYVTPSPQDASCALDNNLVSSTISGAKPLPRPSLDRRNTCGTLYVKSTMAAPDKDATIKCVCGVYRAHLLQAVSDNHSSKKIKFNEYEVFNDSPLERGNEPSTPTCKRTSCVENNLGGGIHTIGSTIIEESDDEIEMSAVIDDQTVPSLEEITDFYRFVFNKAQMESDCIIVSLIYVERLLRDTNGGVWPNPKNWRSLLFSCMVMASKVWDDLSMWNKDFAHVCPSGIKFSLKRINELELALLNCLNFDVKVQASVYAKYYFLMRTMLTRSGLAGDELMTMKPLDNEGAKRLEFVTTNYKPLPKLKRVSQRAKSVGEAASGSCPGAEKEGDINQISWRIVSKQVNLEQVVNM